MSHSAFHLAEAFNLILLIDQTPAARGKREPRFLCPDERPRDYIARHCKGGHWKVHRFENRTTLQPRGLV